MRTIALPPPEANNVLTHVSDTNDFVSGFTALLKPLGVATFELHHFLLLVQLNAFDTIYHEHFTYLSLLAAERIFATNGLRAVAHPTAAHSDCLPAAELGVQAHTSRREGSRCGAGGWA